MQSETKGVLAIIGGLIAIVVVGCILTLVGWQVGWWFTNQNTNREAHLFQNGYAAQSSYVEQARTSIAGIYSIDTQIASPQTPASEKSALQAQRAAEITQTCGIAQNITLSPVPADIQSFIAADCG